MWGNSLGCRQLFQHIGCGQTFPLQSGSLVSGAAPKTTYMHFFAGKRGAKHEGNRGEPLKPLTCAQICPFVTSQACYTKGIWLVDRSVWWCYWCFELCSVASYFAAFTDDSLQRFGKTEPKISTCKAQRGGAKSCWVNVGDFFWGREGCR